MSMWVTPRCDKASTTAFWIAGVEPIVPDSPIPLAPSGLRGLSVWVFDVSKLHIDILACGAQKWLLSPWGSGFVYVRDALVRELRAKVGELVLELDARKKLDALTGKPEKAF